MALKSKFERIDQSKLKQGARDVLAKMKEKSENFTNAEVNKKIEPAIDKLIERLKKENPDALKKASPTRTQKPKATAKKKATKKAPAKKGGAKRETVMTVAKRIRKDGEKWQDALKRAKSEMGKDTKKKVSAVKTEVDKLKKLIQEDAVLKGFANSELQRDAVRKAKPRGKRKTTTKGETTNQYGTFKNKVGRTYWESRENRSDRYAPKFPKNKPYLELGGDVTDSQDLSMANADFLVMAKGGMITSAPEYHQVRNKEYDRRVKSGKIKDTDDNFERFDEMYFDELVEKGRIDPNNYFAKGGKLYYQQDGIGKAKYTVSSYDGKKTHKDGSPFYDIAIFKNKKDLKSYIEKLESEGYKKRFAKGGEIDAFTMSMVKGVDDGISEVETKDLKARMEKGGEVKSKNYIVELRYIGLPIDESMIGKPVMSEETLDRLEDEFKYDITFTPIEETKMKPLSYEDSRKFILDFDRNFKGLLKGYAKGGNVAFKPYYVVLNDKTNRILFRTEDEKLAKLKQNEFQEIFDDKIVIDKFNPDGQGYSFFAKGGEIDAPYLQMSNLDKQGAEQSAKIFENYNKVVKIKKEDNGLYSIYTSSVSGDTKMAKGGQLRGFTNDPIYTEGDISVQRVGGSTMWNVAYKGKPKGRVLDAFTKEQAVRKFEKTLEKGGEIDKSTFSYYKVPNENLWAIQECNDEYRDDFGSSCITIRTKKSEEEAIKEVERLNTLGVSDYYAKGGEIRMVEEFDLKDGIQISSVKTEDGKIGYTASVISYPLHQIVPFVPNRSKEDVIKRAKQIEKEMLEYKKDKQMAKGGRLKSALMRDRKYYNKNEAWERAYSKGKSRRGYKENGGVIENSIQSYQNHYRGFPSYEKGGKIGYRE